MYCHKLGIWNGHRETNRDGQRHGHKDVSRDEQGIDNSASYLEFCLTIRILPQSEDSNFLILKILPQSEDSNFLILKILPTSF
jgi:hypothetical protein